MKTFLRQLTPVAMLAVISIASCGTASAANTWVVTSAADDGGPDTLRYAIYWAQDGDTIVFDSSLNGNTIHLTTYLDYDWDHLWYVELVIDKNLTILGPGPDKLAVSGGFYYRVFEVTGGSQVTISGLSIVEGCARDTLGWGSPSQYSDLRGGAIYNNGNLTLNNCVVSANGWLNDWFVDSEVYMGGGIYNGGTMTINDSTVTNNARGLYGAGGGIYNDGNMEINRGSVFDNYGEWGDLTFHIDNIAGPGKLQLHKSYVQGLRNNK